MNRRSSRRFGRVQPVKGKYVRVYDRKSGSVKTVKSEDRPIRVYSRRKGKVVEIKASEYRQFRKEDKES